MEESFRVQLLLMDALILAILGDEFGQIRVLLGDLLVLLRVVEHLRIAHTPRKLIVSVFYVVQSLKHGDYLSGEKPGSAEESAARRWYGVSVRRPALRPGDTGMLRYRILGDRRGLGRQFLTVKNGSQGGQSDFHLIL